MLKLIIPRGRHVEPSPLKPRINFKSLIFYEFSHSTDFILVLLLLLLLRLLSLTNESIPTSSSTASPYFIIICLPSISTLWWYTELGVGSLSSLNSHFERAIVRVNPVNACLLIKIIQLHPHVTPFFLPSFLFRLSIRTDEIWKTPVFISTSTVFTAMSLHVGGKLTGLIRYYLPNRKGKKVRRVPVGNPAGLPGVFSLVFPLDISASSFIIFFCFQLLKRFNTWAHVLPLLLFRQCKLL